MKSVIVRALERKDLARVAHIVSVNEMFPPDMLEEMTAGHFAGERDAHRWVVAERDRVIGAAYYVPEQLTEGTWNVLMIAVDPDNHGRGAGAMMMRSIETELAAEGVRIILVETSGMPEFERTRGFYNMLDYEREACIRDYYSDGDDKVIFRKALA